MLNLLNTQITGQNVAKPTLALAPMAGITDRVYRQICRELGADYAVAEMVASQKQLRHSRKSATRQAERTETAPRIVQLLGTDPIELAEAAQWQAEQGADIIDFNMGCPAKKVCDVAAGSALMADPDKAARLLEALVKAVELPITLKMRTGIDPEHRNAIELAVMAETIGIQAITLHGRTRADKFNGQAEYDTIKAVKQAIQIPVIANGDICHPNQADFVLKYTFSDGIMIGRAAQGYPWVFREIRHFLTTGDFLETPRLSEFHQVMLRHFTELETLYGSQLGFKLARKHCGWYSQYLPNGCQLRKQFNQLEDTQAQLKLIDQYFEAHTHYDH